MALTTSQINAFIAKAQRALEAYMYDVVVKEEYGEEVSELYLKARYLSGAIRVLSYTNSGLTNLEKQQIVHCGVQIANLNDYSGNELSITPNTIVLQPCCPTDIVDLEDGPGGSLVGHENEYLRVNSSGTAWEWASISTSISHKNVVYVAKDGSDSTGIIERLDRPFLTINAALNAASSGYTIIVFPGTYTPTTLTKDGVTFYFMPGCKVSNTSGNGLFYDGGTAITMNIRGYLEFTSGHVVIKQTAASTINAEFKSIITDDISVYQPSGGGNLHLKVHEDWTSTFAAFRIFNSAAVNSTIYIEARNIYSAGNRIGCTNASGTMKAVIRANKITTDGSSSALNCVTAYAVGTNTLDLTIHADLEKQVSAGAGSIQDPALGAIGWASPNSGVVRLYGDITCLDTGPCIGFGRIGTSAGTSISWFEVHGDLKSQGPAIVTTDDSAIVYLIYGNVYGNRGAALNLASIETSAIGGSVIEIHGTITNSRNNAAAHGWKKYLGAGGSDTDFYCKLKQGATIICVNTSANSLATDGSAVTFDVYNGAAANRAVGAGVVQRISNVLFDTNVS